MTTWRLWQAFKHPPETHPVFQRMTAEVYEDQIELFDIIQRMLIQGQIWLWPMLFMLNMRTLILMVFSGSLYGAVWAIQISSAIATERSTKRYDVLCLSPEGPIGTLWAICMGCLHRSRTLQQVTSQEAWSIRLILLIPITLSLPVIFRQLFALSFNASFITIFAVLAVFYLDHVQSILFGGLAGILASTYAPNQVDQRLWAVGLFLTLQIGSYCLQALLSVVILPAIFQCLNGWQAEIAVAVTSVLTFYGIRELMISQLWRLVVKQLAGSPSESDRLFDTCVERTTERYADPQVVARTP